MATFQYASTISDFFCKSEEEIVYALMENSEFSSTRRTTIDSWHEEVRTIRIALDSYKDHPGFIAFEYTIPRVGGRIDCIIGLKGILFVLEFKTGEEQSVDADKEQLIQYVTDLKNFHFESYDIPIAPIWVVPSAELDVCHITKPKTNKLIFSTSTVCNNTIADCIHKVLSKDLGILDAIDMNNWLYSPYCPTTSIVDAARKLYANNTVENINRSDAKGEDLIRTTNTLLQLIEQAKARKEKYLCLITGVPGAGKTLIGLSVATMYHTEDNLKKGKENRSVYLSGNRPLVMVLQEALARDAYAREFARLTNQYGRKPKKSELKEENVTKTEIRSKIKQFIQLVPAWRKEYLRGVLVDESGGEVKILKNDNYLYNGEGDYFIPYDHVSIYDEAQRAWDKKENSSYIRKKEAHLRNFPEWSEPRFLISCMDRHPDWAVYICLIGNGQDINHGEAGTVEWIRSIKHFSNWKTFAPLDIMNDPEVATILPEINIEYLDGLHLSTDLRSIRAENLACFVDDLLNFKREHAIELLKELHRYPIRITRDINKAKLWVKEHAREDERYGALASSKGQRLKPDALTLLPPNSSEVEVTHWFLGDNKDVQSSYYMEEVATEFQVQGLELDWAIVAWDADMRFDSTTSSWKQYSFRGSKWMNINNEKIRKYQINAYRVILTRARRGMVIYVPKGNPEDHTRNPKFYDGTYQYFKQLGIQEI